MGGWLTNNAIFVTGFDTEISRELEIFHDGSVWQGVDAYLLSRHIAGCCLIVMGVNSCETTSSNRRQAVACQLQS